jgi:hypothetical protein
MTILPHSATINSQIPRLTKQQLNSELRKLEAEARLQHDELTDLVAAHKARPFVPDFITRMKRGYNDSLRQLHSQIDTLQSMIQIDART